VHLPTRHGSQDQERLGPLRDRSRQRGIGRRVGHVLATGEESHERAALVSALVADRPAQHRILGPAGAENRARRDRGADAERPPPVGGRRRPQVRGERDPDHGSVWTSTDTTDGRSRTMGVQLSPASADAYTCPPVVPKYTPHLSSESTAIASRNTLT